MTLARSLLDDIAAAAEKDGFRVHGIHVRLGTDEAARSRSADVRRDIHSVAKGVCVLAAAIAADEGAFDIDEPVATYLPGLATGAGVREVTVRRLLTMTSVIDLPWSETLITDWPDLAAEFLRRPSEDHTFRYSNASTYTAMRALAEAVGDVPAWLEPRLFSPLGIDAPVWERCPNGWIVAGGGLHLTLGELARLGQLIRDGGVWDGERLISAARVREIHTEWIEHDAAPGYRRYALAGWEGPGDAWRLHGAYGQLQIFQGDAIVTVTADDHAGADRMAQRIVDALVAADVS